MRRLLPTRQSLVLPLVSLGVVPGALPGRAVAAAGSPCPPTKAHVVKSDARAVVFSRQPPEEGTLFFGCSRNGGHVYALGEAFEADGGGVEGGGGGISHFALAGTIVAFEEQSFSRDNGSFRGTFRVRVCNLRNGRTVHLVPTGTPGEPLAGDVGAGELSSLVVKSDGSAAWIVHATLGHGSGTYQVHALDRTGSRLLAEGTSIVPRSLRLIGDRLTWRQAGATDRALLD